MTLLEQISIRLDGLNKIASGDMLQYFVDHPDKLKEKQLRDKMKLRLKRMKARRDPDGIEKDSSIRGIPERICIIDDNALFAERCVLYNNSTGIYKKAEPTEAQKKAGNYKMKHIRYNGMEISIENPAGSMRRGKSPDGKEWASHMYHHYGYMRGTNGRDKDHIDVFIKPGTKETEKVFIVNQNNKEGNFDEHKCMLGFTTEIAAKRAYLMNYEKGWKGLGSIVEMPIDEFKKWVYSGIKMGPVKKALN